MCCSLGYGWVVAGMLLLMWWNAMVGFEVSSERVGGAGVGERKTIPSADICWSSDEAGVGGLWTQSSNRNGKCILSIE